MFTVFYSVAFSNFWLLLFVALPGYLSRCLKSLFDVIGDSEFETFPFSIEKLGPGKKTKVQVQRRSLGPKHFTKFGLHTTTTHHHHHTPHPHKLLGHF